MASYFAKLQPNLIADIERQMRSQALATASTLGAQTGATSDDIVKAAEAYFAFLFPMQDNADPQT